MIELSTKSRKIYCGSVSVSLKMKALLVNPVPQDLTFTLANNRIDFNLNA